jgi:membrane protease YdiL (CAAX protease family)
MSDQAQVAAQPHPVVAQLSALHHFRTYVDIAVVVVVLALTNLIAHFTTPWASVATVPAAAVGLLVLVRSRGLGWAELGLGREHWKSGAGYALAAVGVVLSVIGVGLLLPWTRPMFMNNNYATISGALLASMIVIPLQTVIPEELAFRGVLHGALNRAWGFRGVAAAGSLLFGLCHIARPDEFECRVQPDLRQWDLGHGRGGRARGPGHRGGWVRVHLASASQRQPDRSDRTALVPQRAGRAGRRPGVALVDVTLSAVSGAGGPGNRGS